jgi:uncharacterized membrane protein YcaP (DUF421 family)
MFFQDWSQLGRVLVVGALAYAALLAVVRFSGKRTLAKLNAFDLIVTVALGSTLATVVLSPDVTLAQGVIALALLVGLQFAVAWLSVHIRPVRSLVKARPTLIVRRGAFLEEAMRTQRVTRGEVLQVLRQHGAASAADVAAVVLETDGSLSVVRDGGGDADALEDVHGWE